MGKNHRHKKKLKSEKAKVHIKSKTKFLPKGQNVTNTSFKIKPIVIQEQLKEKEQDGLSDKKYNVNELISKLKHYNDSIKTEACHDLKTLIKNHSIEFVQTHLSLLIQNASALIQDREKKVRRACISLLNEIFENVSSVKLEAFSTYILINFKCAMTNIDKNVQEDSLLLLDGLLEHQSDLIAKNFDNFFSDFLTLISKLRSQAGPDRTLTLNLGSKITSVKWRIKVLSRLYGILDIIIQSHQNNNGKNRHNSGNVSEPIIQKASKCYWIPLHKNIDKYERCSVDFFKARVDEHSSPKDKHFSILIPLLYETWVEALPEQNKKNVNGTVLNGESAAVFSCIVNILRLLHEYYQLNNIEGIFTTKENKKFLERLVCGLPYTQNKAKASEFTKDFSKLFSPSYDQNCVGENLILIYLFTIFKTNINSDIIKCKVVNITSFLNKCLSSQNYLNAYNMDYFVKILKELLLVSSKFWHKQGINGIEMIDSLISFYDGKTVTGNFKDHILEILTYTNFPFRYDKLQEWLKNLPRALCTEKVSAKLIDVILNLCRQNHQSIQEGVKTCLKSILDNLPNITITDTEEKECAELKMVYIFFYLPHFNDDELNFIHDFINTHENLIYSKYFKEMLEFRLHVFK